MTTSERHGLSRDGAAVEFELANKGGEKRGGGAIMGRPPEVLRLLRKNEVMRLAVGGSLRAIGSGNLSQQTLPQVGRGNVFIPPLSGLREPPRVALR